MPRIRAPRRGTLPQRPETSGVPAQAEVERAIRETLERLRPKEPGKARGKAAP